MQQFVKQQVKLLLIICLALDDNKDIFLLSGGVDIILRRSFKVSRSQYLLWRACLWSRPEH